jgi:hypothetical protein
MSTAGSKRKYLLFKAGDGRPDHLKPCAFHFSPAGCRGGATCKFSHDPNAQNSSAEESTSIAAVSSKAAPVSHTARSVPPPAAVKVSEARPVASKASMPANRKSSSNSDSDSSSDSDEDLDTPLPSKKQNTTKSVPVRVVPDVPPGLSVQAPAPVAGPSYSAMEAMFQSQMQAMLAQQKLEYDRTFSEQMKVIEALQTKPAPAKATPAKVVKVKADSSVSNTRVKEQSVPKTTPKTPASAIKRADDDDDGAFLFQAVDSVLNQNQTPSPTKATKQPQLSQLQQQLNLNSSKPDMHTFSALPASTVASTPAHDRKRKSVQLSSSNTVVSESVVPAATAEATPTAYSKFAPEVAHLLKQKKLSWPDLVKLTKASARYASDFVFQTDASWVSTRSLAEFKGKAPKDIIAIDCEMCQSEDPLTGTKDHAALVRVSVVNGQNPDEVLLDKLVRPVWPISDMRTHIHGISADDVEKVNYSLRHAQAEILALCSDQTIIVGHGIQNDLKALKLDHK